VRWLGPELGEHNEELLGIELGADHDEHAETTP
jgi:hypothetical protein